MLTMTFTFFCTGSFFLPGLALEVFLLSRCSLSGLLCVDLNDGLIFYLVFV